MKKWMAVVNLILGVCLLGSLIFLWVNHAGEKKEQENALNPGEEEEPINTRDYGLFSWNNEVVTDRKQRARLMECMEQAGVTSLYQSLPGEIFDSGEVEPFIGEIRAAGGEVYLLIGDAQWAYEPEGESLLEEMQKAVRYNEACKEDGRIAGVMVDVEPYLLEEWDAGKEERKKLMESYLSGMNHAYRYAAANGLFFWVCIPTFYNSSCPEVLEELIKSACDGVAVMNYNRQDEYGQIAHEVGYAREYGKKVRCIYELQEAGKHDLEEINTYAKEGLAKLWMSAERLSRQLGYEELGFDYHYYEPLKKMLTEVEKKDE